MKSLKLGVLICGALGLAGIWMSDLGAMLQDDKRFTILTLVAFGLPAVMAVMSLAKPPLQGWQAHVSLAGFALAAAKLRIWETIPAIADLPVGWQLALVGAGLGVMLSLLAAIKPESSA